MTKIEKRIIEFLEKRIDLLAFLFITLLSLFIRYFFRNYLSNDMSGCLLPWYTEIKDAGFKGLANQVGDYNMLYQFLIALFANFLPIKPIYTYKLLSCIFDYVLAISIGYIIYDANNRQKSYFLFAYALVLLCPTVFLNSAAWGQCDVIYTTFIILALISYNKAHYNRMMLMYGFALAFKLQALFVLPLFLFLYIRKKSFCIFQFLWIPFVMLVTSLPNILMGAPVYRLLTNYANQTSIYNKISLSYPSFWRILIPLDNYDLQTFLIYKRVMICFTMALLILLFYYWFKKNISLSFKHVIYMAFLSTYLVILFLPTMHERYGFLYEILALIIIFYNRKTTPLALGIITLTTLAYGQFLIAPTNIMYPVCAFINVFIYLFYLYILNREMLNN